MKTESNLRALRAFRLKSWVFLASCWLRRSTFPFWGTVYEEFWHWLFTDRSSSDSVAREGVPDNGVKKVGESNFYLLIERRSGCLTSKKRQGQSGIVLFKF